jgi:phage gp36-like protein
VAYSVSADVQIAVGGAAKLLALVDHDANGVADTGVVDAAISEADALINSYASKRFAVPFATTPPTIKALSARITARILRRNRTMVLASDVEDEKTDRKWLEQLAAGGVLPGVEPLPSKGSIVTDKAGERDSVKNVSRDKMKGFW